MKSIITFTTIVGFIIAQNSEKIKRCETVLAKFQEQAANIFQQFDSQNYSKMIPEILIFEYFLDPLSEYCPAITMEEYVLDLQYPYDCQSSVNLLRENIKEDSVSNFSTIQEIVKFQASNCQPYDYEFTNGIQDLIKSHLFEQQIQRSKPEQNSENATLCIACNAGITLLENYIDIKGVDIAEFIGNKGICKIFKGIIRNACDNLFDVIGPQLVEYLTMKYNSDTICDKLGACDGYTQCKLHPNDEQLEAKKDKTNSPLMKSLFKKVAPNGWLSDIIDKLADQHLPLLDWDNDRFTDFPQLRGYNWRGEDCEKFNKKVYPGRSTSTGVKGKDYNCNGISGVDSNTGAPYKTEYCQNSGQMGVLVFGDSAGAHFSIPGSWLNVTEWHSGTFSDIIPRLMNELDLPHLSAGTGYLDQPNVNSFYLKMLERNQCNRNDYQNLGVNGAKSTNEMKNMLAVARDQDKDFPVLIFWELIGNDVCNGHGLSSMTTPEDFKAAIIELWDKLDTIVPKGSHMVVTGVADGRILYECLQDKEDPLGIPYPDFYEFLNCLGKSPCMGWMNKDKAMRDATTERANELNKQYQDIIATHTWKNFDIQYYDFPMKEIFDIVISQGGTCQDCIEPVDGFHPSQLAEALWADILWDKLDVDQPTWKGEINPNNQIIIDKFGKGRRFSDGQDSKQFAEKQNKQFQEENQEVIELE